MFLKISEALSEQDYPRVAEKIEKLGIPIRWCDSTECACMGCANQHLSWAEYEC